MYAVFYIQYLSWFYLHAYTHKHKWKKKKKFRYFTIITHTDILRSFPILFFSFYIVLLIQNDLMNFYNHSLVYYYFLFFFIWRIYFSIIFILSFVLILFIFFYGNYCENKKCGFMFKWKNVHSNVDKADEYFKFKWQI